MILVLKFERKLINQKKKNQMNEKKKLKTFNTNFMFINFNTSLTAKSFLFKFHFFPNSTCRLFVTKNEHRIHTCNFFSQGEQ